ncbi:MAG TPA: tripartite tricarboxylate transporter substrate binding protein [Burkholderiales bacterium]|nr:tripartite tricarboxylate transporter substrate binding protein [Burkholderiales bacterium]
MSLLAMTAVAYAQEYPSRPVRVIVPFPPGGPNDLVVRPVAPRLQEYLGQPFVVDNRAGANGIIGSELVAKAPPDGHSLLVISSSFTINPATHAKLPFDPLKDFAPVISLATSDIILVVNPTVPSKTVKEFVALAKSRPGKLNYASSGTGGSLHLAGELLKMTSGINMVHVPYKGAALALSDVVGGHVDSMFIAVPPVLPQLKSGRLRILAVASAKRASSLPDVPTFIEAGLPDVKVDSRYGLLTGAHVPAAVIAKLGAATAKALALPDVREKLAAMGMDASGMPAQEYAAYLREDVAKWKKVVAAAKLPPME